MCHLSPSAYAEGDRNFIYLYSVSFVVLVSPLLVFVVCQMFVVC